MVRDGTRWYELRWDAWHLQRRIGHECDGDGNDESRDSIQAPLRERSRTGVVPRSARSATWQQAAAYEAHNDPLHTNKENERSDPSGGWQRRV